MAWIKIETNLFEKPEVVWLAKALKLKPIMVAGALVRFWSVVDGLTEDGFVALYDGAMVDDVVGVKGFADGMVSVGWLVIEERGILVPGFDKHNGRSAKRRAENARAMAKRRNGEREGTQVCAMREQESTQVCARREQVSAAREEKRRERLSGESLSARVHARGARSPEVPSDGEVEQFGVSRGWGVEEVRKWLLWQRQCGWCGKDGRPIVDWRASLELWMMRASDFDGEKGGRAGDGAEEPRKGRATEDGVDMSVE